MSLQDSAAAIRKRLWNPPNGHHSTELEIVSKPIAARINFDNSASIKAREVYERDLIKQARIRHGAEMIRDLQAKITEWVLGADSEPAVPEIPKILFEQILIAVSKFYVVPRIQIISQRRKANIVRPRHVAMYLAREMTELSLPQIGQRLGGRDHTTCLAGAQKITQMLESGDVKLAGEIMIIRQWLED